MALRAGGVKYRHTWKKIGHDKATSGIYSAALIKEWTGSAVIDAVNPKLSNGQSSRLEMKLHMVNKSAPDWTGEFHLLTVNGTFCG